MDEGLTIPRNDFHCLCKYFNCNQPLHNLVDHSSLELYSSRRGCRRSGPIEGSLVEMSLLLRFGVLLMRTVAKPVSNMVKSTVKSHPAFRALAVGGARLHARTNARWDRLVRRRPTEDKKGNPIQRRELTETEAIDLAADIIGEGFLLSSLQRNC
jgi:hypothetical protein